MMPVMPSLAFAGGGMVPNVSFPTSPTSGSSSNSVVFNIYPQKMDEATVRREVIPVLERYNKQRA
jgi:hypothetical protein